MTLKVIGAGFGRTGTLSLKGALEALGFGPCYHMYEVRAHPEHIAVWDRAADGAPVDWDALFAGFQATVDWPSTAFLWDLHARYPDARIILTTRDPEAWYDSAQATIFQAVKRRTADDPDLTRMMAMADKIVFEQTFGGRFNDRDHAIAVFEDHIAEVRRRVPPQQLLDYDVKEGWAPLCRFLDRKIPEQPFPRVNVREEFPVRAQ